MKKLIGMEKILSNLSHNIDTYLVVLFASTVRLLMDYINRKRVDIAVVALQYLSWVLVGLTVARFFPDNFVYVAVATLLSRDVMSFIVSDQVVNVIKTTILELIQSIANEKKSK